MPHLAKADAGMCILIAPRMLDIGKHDPLRDHVGCLGGICIWYIYIYTKLYKVYMFICN